jgi:hypothetical protein
MRCLERLSAEQHLTELPHAPPFPYAGDKRRRCKK